MALTLYGGLGGYHPPIPEYIFGGSASMLNTTGLVIDATGEKIALIGRYVNATRTTKSIRKVGITFGAVSKTFVSGLTLSLQDVAAAAGPPMQPDETQDQTVAIAAAAVTANTFLMTGNLSADRSIAPGELLAVVLEFDALGRLGTDSYALSQWATRGDLGMQVGTVLKTASWAVQGNRAPVVVFEHSDGTFGGLDGCWPVSAHALPGINSGTTPDEYGLECSFTTPQFCDGAWIVAFVPSGGDFDVVLYENGVAMSGGTVSVDSNQLRSAGAAYHILEVTFPSVLTLAANTPYQLMAKPTTANTMFLPSLDVSVAGHLDAAPGGAAFKSASRVNAGSFTALATRRPFMGLRLAGSDDAAGGGGTVGYSRGRVVN